MAHKSLLRRTQNGCFLGKKPCMGVGWGEIRGFVPTPTPDKGPQFGTKSRRMVFLSALLPRLLRKISEISLRLGRKCKYERLQSKCRAKNRSIFLTVLPLYDDF